MDFYVICYDTPNDKRRRKLSRFLVNYICRVQESVFEGFLKRHAFEKLRQSLSRVINPKEDSLRIYTLNQAAHQRIEVFGSPGLIQNEGWILISELDLNDLLPVEFGEED
ncbi:MAG: CRISPR-associated endonuclease Cas2 [Candidatus Cloacimonetes bacterium]|nr:CRISPR-associated endonuclease Cas2 [Candidatus Cloacimonadota bacterium]